MNSSTQLYEHSEIVNGRNYVHSGNKQDIAAHSDLTNLRSGKESSRIQTKFHC